MIVLERRVLQRRVEFASMIGAQYHLYKRAARWPWEVGKSWLMLIMRSLFPSLLLGANYVSLCLARKEQPILTLITVASWDAA
jgi:hypothetical protein